MIPITTIQGFQENQIRSLVQNKKVYVWGTSILAKIVSTSLHASQIPVTAYLDNRKAFINKRFNGLEIQDVASIVKNAKDSGGIFIVIASEAIVKSAKRQLKENGLKENIDFISYLKISRPFAAVDVHSGCNLQCLCCPQGNFDKIPVNTFSLPVYKKVLDKLRIDMPLLSGVELFTWGEPFLNEQLAEIIEYTERFVPSFVSTNLMTIKNLPKIIEAKPSSLSVTVNSLNKDYEKISKGASWKILIDNLSSLSVLLKQSGTDVFDLFINVKLFVYKTTVPEDIKKFERLCKELALRLSIEYPYLNPYDNFLKVCKKEKISSNAEKIINKLSWDFKKVMKLAADEIDRPCLSQRIFPIINSNLSVALCHTYKNPIIAENYLTSSFDDLLKTRHGQKQCQECQKYGLHRLDLNILNRKNTKNFENCVSIKL